jgi:1,4-dihydroxy-2-naphthoyl-CoA hydrolase
MQGVYRGVAMTAPPFDALYGIEVVAAGGEEARGSVPVADGVRQPAGLVHGGVYASMAESLAVAGTQAATGRAAVGHSSQTSFLRPITEGTVHASGRPRHRGRSTWVWEFDVTDDGGRLCALVRMTVAVRDAF